MIKKLSNILLVIHQCSEQQHPGAALTKQTEKVAFTIELNLNEKESNEFFLKL